MQLDVYDETLETTRVYPVSDMRSYCIVCGSRVDRLFEVSIGAVKFCLCQKHLKHHALTTYDAIHYNWEERTLNNGQNK